MASEAPLRQTEHGLVPEGDGWFVVNAREARWFERGQRGVLCRFEGDDELEFPQVGINLFVLEPGQPMSMYHWEADQEDFLVLSGEALLLVEGEERPLRQWDLAHTPAHASHTIVGAGTGPCVILAIGARIDSTGEDWGGYPVDETAIRHGAGVDEATTSAEEAYGRFPRREPAPYRGWLD
ncbi:MAG TPA: cupin domain-containing protein [Gaiellaceae bacterium]|nr:cupin domain-containing protein [Gaiellaceae bacterium]